MNLKFAIAGICLATLTFAAIGNLSVGTLTGQVTPSTSRGRVSVLDFGAVGDGRTDDRAAIQAAIDAGDEIHFPDVSAHYRVFGSLRIGGSNLSGSKKLIGHRPCRGGTFFPGKPALIHGDGSAALLVAEGTTAQNRAIELNGLSAVNVDKPVLDLMSSTDAIIENCWLSCLKNIDATVRIRDSVNVTIRDSSIHCLGGGFAITAYQQSNKLRIQNCRLGGGDNGGAVHIEQSSAVQFEGNILEHGEYGLVVSSGIRLDRPTEGNVDGAGVCHAVQITANYFENVRYPLVIASALNRSNHPGLSVLGAVIESNNIGSYGFDNPLLTIGRVQAASIRGNSLWRKVDGTSPAILATFAQGSMPGFASDCVIECNHLANGKGPFLDADNVNVGDVPLVKKLIATNKISNPASQ